MKRTLKTFSGFAVFLSLAFGTAASPTSLDQQKMALGKALHEKLYKDNPKVNDIENGGADMNAEPPYLGHMVSIVGPNPRREAFHYYLQHTYNYPASLGPYHVDFASMTTDPTKAVATANDVITREILSRWKGVKATGISGRLSGLRYRDWFDQKVAASGRLDAPNSKAIFAKYDEDLRAKIAAKNAEDDSLDASRAAEKKWQDALLPRLSLSVGGLFLLLLPPLYLLPSFLAWRRKKTNLSAIVLCNLFGGLFLGVGWVVALVWTYTDEKPKTVSNVSSGG